MPSFILRDLNPEFWQRVQAKAAAEGTTVKALILRLLTTWLAAAVILLSVTACGYKNPTAPGASAPPPQPGIPSRLELSANPGTGAAAGTGTIRVRVLDAFATALPDQTVAVTASVGELSAADAVTDAKGAAVFTITGPEGAAIVITATVGTIAQKTSIAMQLKPADPLPLVPPTFPPPSPPPPPPPPPTPPIPSYTVTVSASPASLVVNGSATLTASVVLVNGATAPTSYVWDCDANGSFESPTTGNVVACPYTTAGTIKSAVRVTGANASGSGSVDVTVAAAAPLLVSIGAPTPVLVVKDVSNTFRATVTSAGSVPATLQWEWDDNGDGVYEVIVNGASSPNDHAVSYGTAGDKTIKVRVTDLATGRTAIGTRTVTVAP